MGTEHTFVEFDGNKYRIKPTANNIMGYTVVIRDRMAWKQIKRDHAAKVLKALGYIK